MNVGDWIMATDNEGKQMVRILLIIIGVMAAVIFSVIAMWTLLTLLFAINTALGVGALLVVFYKIVRWAVSP